MTFEAEVITMPYPDFPDYLLSSDGTVTSLKGKMPKKLKIKTNPGGYRFVALRKNGKTYYERIHLAILSAFVSSRPGDSMKIQGRHKNGDKSDNRVENLEWGTRSENELDKRLHGTDNRGERHPLCKLSDREVKAIREEYGDPSITWRERRLGMMPSQAQIANKWKISQSTVSMIVRGVRRLEGN